jgi:hypothetical protein
MFQVASYFNYWDLWTLYHKVTFDGENRIIRVNEGVTEINIKTDIYSDWKEWVKSMPDNAGWLPAIRTIGGDNTVAGQRAGDIYFLINNWKLYIDLTKVKVTGVLFSDNFDSAYFDNNGTIQFPAQVASLVTTAETTSGSSGGSGGATAADVWQYPTRTLTSAAGPTASEIADAVWNELAADHNTDGTFGHILNEVDYLEKQVWVSLDAATNGNGSQENPYDNINDAIDKAEATGIRVIDLIGDITLNRNFKNFTLRGIGEPEVDLGGSNIKNSKFINCEIKGDFLEGSNVRYEDCKLLNGAILEGTYDHCDLAGDLTCQDSGVVLMKDCVSSIAGTGRPTISMNATGSAQLSMRGYNGGLTVKDCNDVADRVTAELNPGSLTFDSSNTNGIMVARGVGKFVDSTAGATVVNEMVNQEMIDDMESKVLELWRLAGLDASNVASITDTSITVGGVTITIGQPDSNTTTLTRT